MNLWAKQFVVEIVSLSCSAQRSCNQMRLQLELAVLFHVTKRGDAQRWRKHEKPKSTLSLSNTEIVPNFSDVVDRAEKQRKAES